MLCPLLPVPQGPQFQQGPVGITCSICPRIAALLGKWHHLLPKSRTREPFQILPLRSCPQCAQPLSPVFFLAHLHDCPLPFVPIAAASALLSFILARDSAPSHCSQWDSFNAKHIVSPACPPSRCSHPLDSSFSWVGSQLLSLVAGPRDLPLLPFQHQIASLPRHPSGSPYQTICNLSEVSVYFFSDF